jgi:1,4-alpha-glucan branching enzyme
LENIYNILDKEGKPDLIHVHDWMGAIPGLILKNMLKLPLVTTLHITSKELNKIYTGGIYDYLSYVEKTLANKSSKVIACSKSMVKEIAENCGITEEKIKLIPNGITREAFQPKENLKD